MKTIEQLAIPKQVDSDFPDGAIINETDTSEGTPVIREIYNDILVNIYNLLEIVGIEPTGTEDSASSQYQIIEALKKLPNSLNDIEQVLSLTGSIWNIPLPIELLPNKYFFIAKASENYTVGASYTFEGSGPTSYSFTSDGFNASDELLLIIDQSGVRAYSLSFLNSASDEIFTVMGLPISFNDGNTMYYQSGGDLVSDNPSVNYLESIIRVELSDGTVIVNDMIISNGYVICLCLIPASNDYFFRHFDLIDLSLSFPMTLIGASFDNVNDFSPYMYAKQGFIYVTNAMNGDANDYSFSKFSYNPIDAELTFISSIDIDNTFVKTSNAVVKLDLIYTLVAGLLTSYNLLTGAKVILGDYGGINGNLFGFNGKTYFSSGEVAKKWNL